MLLRVVPCLLVAALAAGCTDAPDQSHPSAARAADKKPEPAAATPIETATPRYMVRSTVLETSGKVQFDEERLVRVQAPVTGRVLEVLARPGELVEPGHRLLVIDSPDLGAAKADYAKALADVERADKALR